MVEWVAYHGKTGDHHQAQWDDLSKKGFRIISLSVYGNHEHRRYAAIWAKTGGPPQRAFHGRTGDEYQQIFDDSVKAGYRPVIIAATDFNPSIYAGVFEQGLKPFVAHHGMSEIDFQNTCADQNNPGNFALRWAAVYGQVTESGVDHTRYTGIWEPRPLGVQVNWTEDMRQTTGDVFQKVFLSRTKQGFRLAFVTVTGRQPGVDSPISTGHHYFGVYRKDSLGPWLAHIGMTADDYQAKIEENKKQGFMPIVVQAHGQVDNIRYAAIFAQEVL